MNYIFRCLLLGFTVFSLHLRAHDRPFERMHPEIMLEILEILETGGNVIFTKFGDGEYHCMRGEIGCNCDQDTYHQWMGDELKKALVGLSKKRNAYIGKWWTSNVSDFCNAVAKESGVTVPWTWYHVFMNDDNVFNFDYMRQFMKFIVATKRKKILVCNGRNSRLQSFFKTDAYVEIPSRNWSFDYEKWRDKVQQHVEKDCIVLISAGMCSKILINEITDKTDLTCIDLGSSFDILGGKFRSRDFQHAYEAEWWYYKDFIPQEWSD